MKEFGSDFHSCKNAFVSDSNYFEQIGHLNHYASGRLAIEAVIRQERWKRIWIPAYFCHEVVNHISSLGIKIMFYDDNPLRIDDDNIIKTLVFEKGDVLFRVNYLGLRQKRNNNEIDIPVIEDHTHDLISDWALNSDADWCVASIRKSLPVAAGGILWSPKNRTLPTQISSTQDCEEMANIRYKAMDMKSSYLCNGGDKNIFRKKYLTSEEMIENLKLSGMDNKTYEILKQFDIKYWTDIRIKNWVYAYNLLSNKYNILKSNGEGTGNYFSLVILCKSSEERNSFRQYLIKNSIYPAILWNIPENTDFSNALDFSKRMLSIHCDARYTIEDIDRMCKIINAYHD